MKRTPIHDNWIHRGQTITLPHDAMLHERLDPNAAKKDKRKLHRAMTRRRLC